MRRFVDTMDRPDTNAVPQPLPMLCVVEAVPSTHNKWTLVTAKKRKAWPPRSVEGGLTSGGLNKAKAPTSHRR